jgi:prepilin peptidase CpaA
MLEAATLLFFPALMVFAAISDLLTMTISNRVSIALAVLFVGMAFACGLSAAEIAGHLACGLRRRDACPHLLHVCARLDRRRRCEARGGDGDLARVRSSRRLRVFGERSWRFAHTRHSRASKLPLPGVPPASQWCARLLDPATGIPYGVALACAGLLLYPSTAIWLSVANALR